MSLLIVLIIYSLFYVHSVAAFTAFRSEVDAKGQPILTTTLSWGLPC